MESLAPFNSAGCVTWGSAGGRAAGGSRELVNGPGPARLLGAGTWRKACQGQEGNVPQSNWMLWHKDDFVALVCACAGTALGVELSGVQNPLMWEAWTPVTASDQQGLQAGFKLQKQGQTVEVVSVGTILESRW